MWVISMANSYCIHYMLNSFVKVLNLKDTIHSAQKESLFNMNNTFKTYVWGMNHVQEKREKWQKVNCTLKKKVLDCRPNVNILWILFTKKLLVTTIHLYLHDLALIFLPLSYLSNLSIYFKSDIWFNLPNFNVIIMNRSNSADFS